MENLQQKYRIRKLRKLAISVNLPEQYHKLEGAVAESNLNVQRASFQVAINRQNGQGKTLLRRAVVMHGDPNVINMLIEGGADVNVKAGNGQIALFLGVLHCRLKVVKCLLDSTSALYIRNTSVLAPTRESYKQCNIPINEAFLDYKRVAIHAQNNEGRTPLFQALVKGYLEIATCLIDKGTDVYVLDSTGNNPDSQGRTPLHKAVKYDSLEFIQRIVDKGVNINAKDWLGKTALYEAVVDRCIAIMEILIKGAANLNDMDIEDNSPVRQSMLLHGNTDIAQLFLVSGADADRNHSRGRTLLHKALIYNKRTIVNLIIDHGSKVDVRDIKCRTTLHETVRNDMPDIIQASVNAKDKGGITPLHIGVTLCRLTTLEPFTDLSHNLHQENRKVNAVTQYRRDRGMLLRDDCNIDDCRNISHLPNILSSNTPCIVKLLTDSGENVNAYDNIHRTILHCAVTSNVCSSLDIVKLLCKDDVDVDAKDDYGRTPLHDAVKHCSHDIVHILIDNGANVCCQALDGRTPLHKAALYGDSIKLNLLLEHADPCIADFHGNTAIHYAIPRVLSGSLNEDVLPRFYWHDGIFVDRYLTYEHSHYGITKHVLEFCMCVCEKQCFNDKSVGVFHRLVQCGCGINRQCEVDELARCLLARDQYRVLLYLITAGLYPASHILKDWQAGYPYTTTTGDLKKLAQCMNKLNQVQPLTILCRNKIRKVIFDASAGFEIASKIRKIIIIPDTIRRFLCLEGLDLILLGSQLTTLETMTS